MISLKSRGFHSCRVIVEPEAAHDIFDCEFLRQPIESLDGLLSALYVGCSIAVLIVEIGFCQSAKVVALTSILDVGVLMVNKNLVSICWGARCEAGHFLCHDTKVTDPFVSPITPCKALTILSAWRSITSPRDLLIHYCLKQWNNETFAKFINWIRMELIVNVRMEEGETSYYLLYFNFIYIIIYI